MLEGNVEVISPLGRVLYFSTESFINKIAGGDVCFICGAEPDAVVFNDEHVVPDWILSRHNLHSRVITLPNKAEVKYGQYKVPCCKECNRAMSRAFETPISDLVKKGYIETINQIREDPWLIFSWLALIFLKTHLKDKQFRFHRDRRKADGSIAEFYDWKELHHIHCIARAFHTGAVLDRTVFGSLFVWPVRSIPGDDEFDYADSFLGRTILLRTGDIAFIAVLNDSRAVQVSMKERLQCISGPLSSLQLRELMVRMAFANIHLTDRPQYRSGFENLRHNPDMPGIVISHGEYNISAVLSETISFEKVDPLRLGEMLVFYLSASINSLLPPKDRESVISLMKNGTTSLIFGSDGEFLINPKMDEY